MSIPLLLPPPLPPPPSLLLLLLHVNHRSCSYPVWRLVALSLSLCSMLQRIDSLKFASMCVLVSAASICITSLAFALFPARLDAHVDCEMGASACRGEIAMLTDASRTLVAMPSFLFAYSSQVTVQPFGTLTPHSHTRSHIALSAIPPSCFPQANIPALRAELDRPTRSRMLMVILGARFGAESRTTGWPVPRPCHTLFRACRSLAPL